MRLLIINENPLETQNGRYYTSFSWPFFARRIAEYVEHTTLWSPLREIPNEDVIHGQSFAPGRLEIVGAHYYTGFFSYYLTYLPNYRRLNKKAEILIRSHDISLIRVPSPILPLVMKYSRRFGRPFVMLVAGNLASSSISLLTSKGFKRMVYKKVINFLLNQEYKCAQNASLVYVYGEELAEHFCKFCSNVKLMRTSHISLTDISPREDTCTGSTVQLLRVCWLGPSKGLEYLLEAISILRKDGLPVYLRIVGKEIDRKYGSYLRKMVQNLHIGEYVEFTGWIPFEELTNIYKKSDIQVVSSTAEGIPRVILEGAARGLPLVCTSAGGCASAIRDGEEGILVPPGDSRALAEGIKRVIQDGELRRKIIKGGLEMAKRYSSEVICPQIVDDLNKIVESFPYNFSKK